MRYLANKMPMNYVHRSPEKQFFLVNTLARSYDYTMLIKKKKIIISSLELNWSSICKKSGVPSTKGLLVPSLVEIDSVDRMGDIHLNRWYDFFCDIKTVPHWDVLRSVMHFKWSENMNAWCRYKSIKSFGNFKSIYFSLWSLGVVLHANKLNTPLPNHDFLKIWLKLGQWLLKFFIQGCFGFNARISTKLGKSVLGWRVFQFVQMNSHTFFQGEVIAKIKIFFSRTIGLVSTKLVTKHPLRQETYLKAVCSKKVDAWDRKIAGTTDS